MVAGPGTGKTKTLTDRIAHLISGCGVKPSEITAVTFTNQAAKEMRERLEQRLGGKRAVSGMTIGTFHAICLRQLEDVRLIGEAEALALAAQVLARLGESRTPRQFLQSVSRRKNGFFPEDAGVGEEALAAYQEALAAEGVLDFDDLLLRALEQGLSLIHIYGQLTERLQSQFRLSRKGWLRLLGLPPFESAGPYSA